MPQRVEDYLAQILADLGALYNKANSPKEDPFDKVLLTSPSIMTSN